MFLVRGIWFVKHFLCDRTHFLDRTLMSMNRQQQQVVAAAAPASFLNKELLHEGLKGALSEILSVEGSFDPDAPLQVDHFDSHTNRTYDISLTCTLNDLASGKVSPSISCPPGKEHIYQRIEGYLPDGKPVYGGDKSKGLVMVMDVLDVKNNFPVKFGLLNSHFVGEDVEVNTGKSYLATFWSRTQRQYKPGEKSVASHRYPNTFRALQEYNTTSLEELKSHCQWGYGVGAHKTTVNIQSPLTAMMAHNAKIFGMDFSGLDLTTHGRFEAPTEIVNACLEKFGQAIAVNFIDMNKFSWDFERADGREWNSRVGVEDNASRTHNGNDIMNKTFTFEAKINTKIVLYGNDPQSAASMPPTGGK